MHNFALQSGGTFLILRESSSSSHTHTITINDTYINGSLSFGSGGFIYIDHKSAKVIVNNTYIFNTSSRFESGGMAFVPSVSSYLVKGSSVVKSSAGTEGHVLYSTSNYNT
jgi:hypothetical protein